jgi:hypothetical protein
MSPIMGLLFRAVRRNRSDPGYARIVTTSRTNQSDTQKSAHYLAGLSDRQRAELLNLFRR